MVTREIDGETPQDRSILRHVVKDLTQNVGVYATVTTPGASAPATRSPSSPDGGCGD